MNRKSTLLALLCVLFAFEGFAQSSKMVFVEEGTQASCPPCASQNPAFDALLDANADKVVVLKYQTSWPGFDQMNLDNPDEVQDRVDYYGIQGVPSGIVNGQFITNDCGYYQGAPACLSQAEINAANTSNAAFDLDISATFEDGILNILGGLTANEAVSGDLKLRIALTEKTIYYEDAPGGGNGETQYHHVLKKFIIGGTAGIDLSNSWEQGDSYTLDESIGFEDVNIYRYPELEIVAFVQDDNTKAVYQAAKDDDIELITSYTNNAAPSVANELSPIGSCGGEHTIAPIITIQNRGSEVLTSADIVWSINDGSPQTYAWTGALATLETDQITFADYTFAVELENAITVTLENPNGAADENTEDNTFEASFPRTKTGSDLLTLELMLDFFGTHTTWELRNTAGDVLYNGGPYTNGSFETILVDMPLPEDGCYDFEIFDSAGNGICCSLGEGLYTLTDETGTILAQGSQYGLGEATSVLFDSDIEIGVEETIFEDAFTLSPNPTSGRLTLDFSTEKSADTTVSIYDMMGAEVMIIDLGTLPSGPHVQNIEMGNLPNGIYVVRLAADGGFISKKVILF